MSAVTLILIAVVSLVPFTLRAFALNFELRPVQLKVV